MTLQFPGNPQAMLTWEVARQFSHFLLPSKSNSPASSSALQQTSSCGYLSFSVLLPRRFCRSWCHSLLSPFPWTPLVTPPCTISSFLSFNSQYLETYSMQNPPVATLAGSHKNSLPGNPQLPYSSKRERATEINEWKPT